MRDKNRLLHRGGGPVLLAAGMLLVSVTAARAEVETVTVQLEEARCFS